MGRDPLTKATSMSQMSQMNRLIGLTLPGFPDPSIAIAASRSGALGVLDLEYTRELDAALARLTKLGRLGTCERGVKIDVSNDGFASSLGDRLPPEISTIIIARCLIVRHPEHIQALHRN